jgi:HK97 gp10 family phage protein
MAVRVVIFEPGVIEVQTAVDREVDAHVVEPIKDDMERMAPVLTGALQGTIRKDPTNRSGLHRIWVGDVAAGVDYHLYQEYGTSKMDAQPYIRPAVYRTRG